MTLRPPFSAFSASIAAVSSIRLLVVSGSPPCMRLAMLAGDQHGTPTARTGIPPAGAVGINLNRLASKRIRDTLVVWVSASPATTFGLRRQTRPYRRQSADPFLRREHIACRQFGPQRLPALLPFR